MFKNNTRISGRNKRIIIIFGTVLTLSTLIYSVTSMAHWYGITGQTNNGCTCHGSPNSNTILIPTIQSGVWSVLAGSTSTITINVANSQRAHAGIDIAVKTTSNGETDIGSLSPVSGYGLQKIGSELTHTNPIPYSGGSVDFQFTWTAPSTPGTYYLKAAGNAVDSNNQNTNDQWNFMSVRSIVVTAPPSITITSPIGGEAWCAGSTKNITWTSQSVNNVKIELSSDGGSTFGTTLTASVPASTGSWSWSIPSNQTVGNSYKVRISDASSASIFDISAGNFSIPPPTTITQQPQPITACTGSSAQLSLTALGNNLSYQWRQNGSNIPGSNSSTYTINPVTVQSAGNYDCIVTGTCGNPVNSSLALVTVNISPSITTQPVSKIVCAGLSATFSVTAAGTGLTYQWKKDGQNLTGKTASSLTLDNVSNTDAGDYQVVVSGVCDPSVTSQTATLTVPTLPVINIDPKSQTICEGSKLILYTQVTGTNLTYSWWKDNTEIANSNNDSLIIQNAEITDAGSYFVKVSTDCDLSTSSAQASVIVNQKPLITKQPVDLVVTKGQKAELSVTASGSNLLYQWIKNGTEIQGATQSNFTINQTQVSDSGNYVCKITNSCGNILSNQVKLTVQETAGPVISFSSNPLDLGKLINGNTKDYTITGAIINLGSQDLTITAESITGSDASNFEIVGFAFPKTLKPGEKSDLTIKFKPTTPGGKAADINFTSNSSVNNTLIVNGFSAVINLELSSSDLTFTFNGVGNSSTQDLHIINQSNTDLNAVLSLNGTDSSSFAISSADSIKVLQQEDHIAKITFLAPETKNKSANLKIFFPEVNYEKNVTLTATYVNSVYDPMSEISVRIYPNPSSKGIVFDFGQNLDQNTEIQIYSENGILIRKLGMNEINGNQMLWDLFDNNGNTSASGIYSALIIINDKVYRQPIILSK